MVEIDKKVSSFAEFSQVLSAVIDTFKDSWAKVL